MLLRSVLLWLIVISFSCFGQVQNLGNTINSHIFRFSDTLETVNVEDALSYGSERALYRWLLRLSYDHVNNSVIAVDPINSNTILNYVDNLQTATLGGSYLFGYNKRVLLGFSLPIHSVLLSSDGAAITGGDTERKTTLGDANLYLKWRLTGKNSKWNLALSPRVSIPTGDDKYLVSDGSMGYGMKLILDRAFGSLSIYSSIGFFDAGDAGFLSINRGRRGEGGLGIFWRLSKLLGINLEVTGDVPFEDVEDNQNSFDAIAGVRIALKKMKLFLGTSLAGIQSSTSHEFAFYAGLKVPMGIIGVPIDPGPKVVVEEEDLIPVEEPAPVTERVQVSNVTLFATNKSIIKNRYAFQALDKAAAVIVHFQDRLGKIVIEGHTDSVGKRRHNQGLSERRARAVKDYLIKRGVMAQKLMVIGYGEDRLKISPERNASDRRQNRRAEFLVDENITIREL